MLYSIPFLHLFFRFILFSLSDLPKKIQLLTPEIRCYQQETRIDNIKFELAMVFEMNLLFVIQQEGGRAVSWPQFEKCILRRMVNIWVWRWESIFFQLARYFICVNLELTYKVIKSKCLLFVTMPKQECGFIQRLYAAIEEQRSSIVDWDPSGKGFIVGNLIQFTNQILLRKFGIGRLDSFARKLNRHGFKRSKIDKNKIRFFHKYFNRQSKNLSKIKKLSKYESLPKHIKLRMIRQQLIHKNGGSLARQSDIVNEIFETVKINEEEPDQDASDNKEEKMGQNQAYNENDESLNEDEAMIKIQQNHYIGLLRTPQSKYVELGSDNEETKRAINNKTLHYDDESQEASC